MNTKQRKVIIGNLIYIIRDHARGSDILLPLKAPTEKALKRGLANKRNSYGGGFEHTDSSHLSSVLRELYEEGGITLSEKEVEEVAVITFHNTWGDYECHIFMSRSGNTVVPKESREMIDPRWFPLDEIPFHDMLQGDAFVLPRIVYKRPPHTDIIKGDIWYDEHMHVLKTSFK